MSIKNQSSIECRPWRDVQVDGVVGAKPAVRPELSVDPGAVSRRDHAGLQDAVRVSHAVPVIKVTDLWSDPGVS